MVPSSPSHRYVAPTEPSDTPHTAHLGVQGAQPASVQRDEAVASFAPTDRIDEFVANPIGRCIVGPSFLTWCATPELQGAIIWGTVDDQSLRDMMAAGEYVRHPAVSTRRRVLVDCRDITRADADALLQFASLARDRLELWRAGLEREAIAIPQGVPGILIGGALPSLGVALPMRFTHDLESALAYIDHPAARAYHEAAARIAAGVRGRAVLIARLRVQLQRELDTATVESIASALGMSARTLQRELARLNTSFSTELRGMRVAAAETLLQHSDLKIEAIATQVGFGNASRMSATLRRERNATASMLRARARSAGQS